MEGGRANVCRERTGRMVDTRKGGGRGDGGGGGGRGGDEALPPVALNEFGPLISFVTGMLPEKCVLCSQWTNCTSH